MITAHGATLTVTNEALTLTPTPLAASLQGGSSSREVAIADIAGATSTLGDAWTRSRGSKIVVAVVDPAETP